MHPKLLSINDFTYSLPQDRIAQFPLINRDESKLLIYNNGRISETVFLNISDFLREDSLMIFNDTKVIEARLLFKQDNGVTIEFFCLEPYTIDVASAMLSVGKVQWKCLIGGFKKWKNKTPLIKTLSDCHANLEFKVSLIERVADIFIVEFSWSPGHLTFEHVLHLTGSIPLPPYIHRDTQDVDILRYQTIYAKREGSVAAPTAGLHFTDPVFQNLAQKRIKVDFVTLHVSAGTFRPVNSAVMQDHVMHEEFIEVSATLIANIINNLDKTIVAVGTTTLRTIESLYWMGAKVSHLLKFTTPSEIKMENLVISQWEPYDLLDTLTTEQSLGTLAQWMTDCEMSKIICSTQILIAPPYKAKIANALITNFHQPKSTLLLLVAAFIGDDWKTVYNFALNNSFRFLSYGDCCLLFRA